MFIFILISQTVVCSKLFCTQDEILLVSETENYMNSEISVSDQIQDHLKIITTLNFEKLNYTLKFGEVLDETQIILLFYHNERQYIINEFKFKILFNQNNASIILDKSYDQNFSIEYKCEDVYASKELIFLICDSEGNYIIYQINNCDSHIKEKTIPKVLNCILDVQLALNNIYLIQKNCSEWHIQIFGINDFKLINNIDFTINNEPLRHIVFSQHYVKLYLQFDQKILSITPEFESLNLEFTEDQSEVILIKIQTIPTGFIMVKQNSLEKQEIELKLTQDLKKELFIINLLDKEDLINLQLSLDSVFLLYRNHFLFFKPYSHRKQLEKYPFELFKIQNIVQTSFFFGFDKQRIILLQQHIEYPLLNCNKIKDKVEIILQKEYLIFTNPIKEIEIEKLDIDTFKLANDSSMQLISKNFQCTKKAPQIVLMNFKKFIIGMPAQFKPYNVSKDFQITFSTDGNPIFCQIHKEQRVIWWRIFYIYQQYILLVQTTKFQLILQNCNTAQKMEFGIFQEILYKFVYFHKNQILISLYQQQILLCIVIELLNHSTNIQKRMYKFDKKLLEVYFQNNQIYFTFEDCSEYQFRNSMELQEKSNHHYYKNPENERLCLRKYDLGKIQVYLVDSKIYFFQQNIQIEIQNLKVIDIIEFYKKTSEISLLYFDENENIQLGQFILVNYRLIKMYDFPSYGLSIVYPVVYKIYNFKIAIVFVNIRDDIKYLLIFDMQQEKFNSLIDIVQIDSIFFEFQSSIEVIYLKSDSIYLKNFLSQQFEIMTDNFKGWEKSFKISFSAAPILNPKVQLNLSIDVSLQNTCWAFLLLNQSYILKTQQLEAFDPRLYAQGPISKIISNQYNIIEPIQLNSISDECKLFWGTSCTNSFVMRPFLESNFTIEILLTEFIQTFKSKNYVFILQILQQQNSMLKIFILQQNGSVDAIDQLIKFQEEDQIQNIISIDQYIFIFHQKEIQIYQFNNNKLVFINQLQQFYKECHIIKALNKNDLYIIYESELQVSKHRFSTIIIEKNIREQFQFQEIELKIEQQKQIVIQSFSLHLNLNLQESKYLIINALSFQSNYVAYIVEIEYNFQANHISKYLIKSKLRYQEKPRIQKMFLLSKNILIMQTFETMTSFTLYQLIIV